MNFLSSYILMICGGIFLILTYFQTKLATTLSKKNNKPYSNNIPTLLYSMGLVIFIILVFTNQLSLNIFDICVWFIVLILQHIIQEITYCQQKKKNKTAFLSNQEVNLVIVEAKELFYFFVVGAIIITLVLILYCSFLSLTEKLFFIMFDIVLYIAAYKSSYIYLIQNDKIMLKKMRNIFPKIIKEKTIYRSDIKSFFSKYQNQNLVEFNINLKDGKKIKLNYLYKGFKEALIFLENQSSILFKTAEAERLRNPKDNGHNDLN